VSIATLQQQSDLAVILEFHVMRASSSANPTPRAELFPLPEAQPAGQSR
jgi:hypothetical protein